MLKHTGGWVWENARKSHTGKEANMCRSPVCLLASTSHLLPMTSYIKRIVASMCYRWEDQAGGHTAHQDKLGSKSKSPAVLHRAAHSLLGVGSLWMFVKEAEESKWCHWNFIPTISPWQRTKCTLTMGLFSHCKSVYKQIIGSQTYVATIAIWMGPP